MLWRRCMRWDESKDTRRGWNVTPNHVTWVHRLLGKAPRVSRNERLHMQNMRLLHHGIAAHFRLSRFQDGGMLFCRERIRLCVADTWFSHLAFPMPANASVEGQQASQPGFPGHLQLRHTSTPLVCHHFRPSAHRRPAKWCG
jgi:hypothetical protein